MFDQLKMVRKMMADKNMQKFLFHPKVQELMKDPDFIQAAKSKDPSKLASNAKMQEIANDPELKELLKNFNPAGLF